MSAPTLDDLKAFLRTLGHDLDESLNLALVAAVAEAEAFIGGQLIELWPDEAPGDVAMAVLLLAQTHADAGTPQEQEYRRTAAQQLLRPHRIGTGLGRVS
jgi:hypothetical protein